MIDLPLELKDIISDYSMRPPFPTRQVLENILDRDKEQYGIDILIAYGSDVMREVEDLISTDIIVDIVLTRTVNLSDIDAGELWFYCVFDKQIYKATELLEKYPNLRPYNPYIDISTELMVDDISSLYLTHHLDILGYKWIHEYKEKCEHYESKDGTLYKACIDYLNYTPINPGIFLSTISERYLAINEDILAAISAPNLAQLIIDNPKYNIINIEILWRSLVFDYVELELAQQIMDNEQFHYEIDEWLIPDNPVIREYLENNPSVTITDIE